MNEFPQGIPDGITLDDVEQAIRDFDAGADHDFGPSTSYDLVFEGRRYPPKAIVGLAARRLSGRTLGPHDFFGGVASKSFRILNDLGFRIERKEGGVAEAGAGSLGAVDTFHDLVPDLDQRKAVAEVFASTIRRAHEIGAGAWVLTCSNLVRLNVGKVAALTLDDDGTLSFLADREALEETGRLIPDSWGRPDTEPDFKSLPTATWRTGPVSEVLERWEAIGTPHVIAVEKAAKQVRYSTWARCHQPDVVEEIGALAGTALPQPERPAEPGFELEDLVWLINRHFDNWQGFDHPRFFEDEVQYKRDAAEKAEQLLGRSEMEDLVASRGFDEIIDRLDKVGHLTNLLFLGVPSQGDLNILFDEKLDKAGFCEQMLGLIHGEADAVDRLAAYLEWVQEQGLPSKWTFPTYFLFLMHPSSEIFIKPRVIESFLKLLDPVDRLSKKPNAEEYARVRDIASGLFDSLSDYGPHDMIDVQGFIWVCGSTKFWKIAPGEGGRLWDEFKKKGCIGIGWDELGDLSDIKSKEDFDKRIAPVVADHDDWNEKGLKQLWQFLSSINEHDVIVANNGTSKVLGIGTVAGDYFFAEGQEFGHRRPVHWDESEPRTVEFDGWRRTLIELKPRDMKKILDSPTEGPDGGGVFSARAFELLGLLDERPEKAVYDEHKDEFVELVEKPFRSMMTEVANRLRPEIRDLMETKKRIFSRIPKNDYGRGGAWPFYWGAFYPKDGKRTEDAQLFVWMPSNGLDAGFYFGEYGSEQKERFLANCARHRDVLEPIFRDFIDSGDLVFGSRDAFFDPDQARVSESTGWREWLAQDSDKGIRVGAVFNRDEVLRLSKDDLVNKIAATFERLFPLVYLATSDDPMPLIGSYVGVETEIEEDLNPEYSLEQISEETGFELTVLNRWVNAINRKNQAVFFGPPGTGKTFVAEKMAQHLVGGGDGLWELVQFHPAYAYEDFMQGIRPRTRPDGSFEYRMEPGRFLSFCAEAKTRNGTCVLIVDEINRANLARVFGELMYLLEYRDHEVPLAGGGRLKIPGNVRLIGTMNTADRSIALVDHALRRRFAFISLYPQYDVLLKFHEQRGYNASKLVGLLRRVNGAIDDPHYEVGISFFLKNDLESHLEDIWRMEIEPYLEEYFFDQRTKVGEFLWAKVAEKLK